MADGATVRLNVKVSTPRPSSSSTPPSGDRSTCGTTGPIIIGTAGCKVDPIADGNINLQNNFGPIAIRMMTVKNNIITQQPQDDRRLGNTVGNNIQVVGKQQGDPPA